MEGNAKVVNKNKKKFLEKMFESRQQDDAKM